MKRVFLLIVVPVLLVALGFAQTPAASTNTDQTNIPAAATAAPAATATTPAQTAVPPAVPAATVSPPTEPVVTPAAPAAHPTRQAASPRKLSATHTAAKTTPPVTDRKSTRLNSSHLGISY